MRRGLFPGSTAITLRSSIVPWQPRMFCTWCVSKLTWSFGLVRFSSSKIHWRAAPTVSGAAGSEQVLRVLKLESFCSSCCSRSSEIDDTSFSIRGSIACARAGAGISTAAMATPHQTIFRCRTARMLLRILRGPSPPSCSFVFLPYLGVFEIVARGNGLGAAERGVVEVDPRLRTGGVGQHDIHFRAHVEAAIGIVVAVAFDVVERGHHGRGFGHAVDLPPDVAVRRGDRRRVEAEIEQRTLDRTAAEIAQLV